MGLAVTQECAAEVQKISAETKNKCMNEMTKKVVEALKTHDLSEAMARSQAGLHDCVGLRKPCDFQFAPMITMQIVQVAEEHAMEQQMSPPITEVLLTALNKVEQMSSSIA